ncbi:MAG TPA: glycosyl hydrolase, partial [Burkholderiaceae bacterium]
LSYLQGLSGHGIVGGLERDHNATLENQIIADEGGATLGYFGGDFGFGSAASPASRAALMQQLIQQSKLGVLVHLIYHACTPTQAVTNTDEQNCYWGSGGGVSPSSLSDAQWSDLITSGGHLNTIWKQRLDIIAPYFKTLQDAGVQVIFRPFHELNQGAFWWGGRPGAQGSAALFQLTEDYIKQKYGYTNIIWEWDIQDLTAPSTYASYAPAASYYQIAALDMYNSASNSGYTQANYNALLAIANGKPIAIGESFVVPSASTLAAQPKWVYFEGWPDSEFTSYNSSAQIQTFYKAAIQPKPGF